MGNIPGVKKEKRSIFDPKKLHVSKADQNYFKKAELKLRQWGRDKNHADAADLVQSTNTEVNQMLIFKKAISVSFSVSIT